MTTAKLVTQQSKLGQVKRITHAGREYLTAPVVAIVEGVLNGELVPAEEIGKYAAVWNGIPVPLGHPSERGAPVSANTPDIVARSPGRFWNAQFDGRQLSGEIWLDVAQAQALGGEALEALKRFEEGTPTEVSTAYWRDLDETSGSFNGAEYSGIARNLRPDHLALLLDQEGACNWQMGCGVPRVNADQENTGVMIAFFLDPADAAVMALQEEGLPNGSSILLQNELHVTLAYLGNVNEIQARQSDLLRTVMAFAEHQPVTRARISGVGRFNDSHLEGMTALYASVDSEQLQELRRQLVGWLIDMGLPVSRGFGFTPHITLAYIPASAPNPNVLPAEREMVFSKIAVAWGDQVTAFPLQGEAMNVVNKEAGVKMKIQVNIELSLDEQLSRVYDAFRAAFGPPDDDPSVQPRLYVREVFDDRVIASGGPEGLFSYPYVMDGDGTITFGEPTQVEVVYQPINNGKKEVLMDKNELIRALVANGKCPLKQEELEKLDVDGLQRLQAACEAAHADPPAGDPPAGNAAPEIPEEIKALAKLVEDLGGAEAVKTAIQGLQANDEREKANLVAELAGNQACAFEKTELDAMSLATLRKLQASLLPANYAGRGGPRFHQADEKPVPDPISVVLAKE